MDRYVNNSSQGCHRDTHSILFTSSGHPRSGQGRSSIRSRVTAKDRVKQVSTEESERRRKV